jgi:hypothetical protein
MSSRTDAFQRPIRDPLRRVLVGPGARDALILRSKRHLSFDKLRMR